jgi:hypothetical protein
MTRYGDRLDMATFRQLLLYETNTLLSPAYASTLPKDVGRSLLQLRDALDAADGKGPLPKGLVGAGGGYAGELVLPTQPMVDVIIAAAKASNS